MIDSEYEITTNILDIHNEGDAYGKLRTHAVQSHKVKRRDIDKCGFVYVLVCNAVFPLLDLIMYGFKQERVTYEFRGEIRPSASQVEMEELVGRKSTEKFAGWYRLLRTFRQEEHGNILIKEDSRFSVEYQQVRRRRGRSEYVRRLAPRHNVGEFRGDYTAFLFMWFGNSPLIADLWCCCCRGCEKGHFNKGPTLGQRIIFNMLQTVVVGVVWFPV
eukprot:UN34487